MFEFSQHGQGGAWFSELLPHTASMADDLAVIRSMHTDAINHEPGITFIQTGQQIPGRPCIGAWFAYGLGSMNEDLPTFVVMNAERSHPRAGVQAISAKLWSAGFLSPEYAGVGLRTGADPVLYLRDPDGVSPGVRREMLDGLDALNRLRHEQVGDPETLARIEQYEMAFRMQSSVPEMADLSSEPDSTFERWGEEAKQAGKFQNAALMARRLVERGVRFVQIYHRGWDVHSFAPQVLPAQARDVDRAAWALIQDLKERGLFDETLVIWGGEFGRTIYSQGRLTPTDYGRDHHPRCYSLWMAGGGVQGGTVYGETDDFSYNIVRDPVHIRDFQATILHLFRHRPRAVHPQAPRARRPVDGGRAGPGGARSPRVISPVAEPSGLGHRHPRARPPAGAVQGASARAGRSTGGAPPPPRRQRLPHQHGPSLSSSAASPQDSGAKPRNGAVHSQVPRQYDYNRNVCHGRSEPEQAPRTSPVRPSRPLRIPPNGRTSRRPGSKRMASYARRRPWSTRTTPICRPSCARRPIRQWSTSFPSFSRPPERGR